MWLLKSLLKAPPGSFRYEQTQGVYKKFDASPLIVHLAHSVSDLRTGNNLPRSSFEEALEDIIFYNCQRLGFNTRWCHKTNGESLPVAFHKSKGCQTCGRPV